MPTYNQGHFISRSIQSLLLQSFENWELIIINDGSSDYSEHVIKEFTSDRRIKYLKNKKNKGLGYSINKGLQYASNELIAYLPSDDIYFEDHLQKLYDTMVSDDNCSLVYSGMVYSYTNSNFSHFAQETLSIVHGWYQLVQVMHKKTDAQWMERRTLVTDDLNQMYWDKLLQKGKALPTQQITCEWVSHPEQRHKLIKETSSGGIFAYKLFYKVSEPIRFHSTAGNYIDEVALYERFRQPNKTTESTKPSKPLKILIVGELAYNPERICALEEYGHKLYGLWILNPEFYNTIGPLPFGNVENISLDNWKEKIDEIKPDIIYALLNFQVIPLAHYIMTSNPGVPFVWHFKEGPFYARQSGLWKQLLELYTNSDGQKARNRDTAWEKKILTALLKQKFKH
ncbi:MAG: glycosyltransferase family 2 protein [Ginsengibacter sp.]